MGHSLIERLQEIPYVEGGRDLSGCDCWGLVILYYSHVYGFDMPKFEDIYYRSSVDYETTVESIEIEKNKLGIFEEQITPEQGDIVLINARGRPLHMGIVLDNTDMVHTDKRHGVVIESYKGAKWVNRIVGFYRLKK